MGEIAMGNLGFVAKSEIKQFRTLQCAAALGAKIYANSPVKIVAGYVVNAADTGEVAGIAQHHQDASPGEIRSMIVATDPDTIYEATGDQAAVRADIGKFVGVTAASDGTGSNDRSTSILEVSAATDTVTADLPYVIVGLPEVVENVTTNLRVLVKLVEPALDKGFPAS